MQKVIAFLNMEVNKLGSQRVYTKQHYKKVFTIEREKF